MRSIVEGLGRPLRCSAKRAHIEGAGSRSFESRHCVASGSKAKGEIHAGLRRVAASH